MDTVDEVQVPIDGGAWHTATGTMSWSWTWDSTQASDGPHTIEARSLEGESVSELASVQAETDNPLPDLEVEARPLLERPGDPAMRPARLPGCRKIQDRADER